MTASGTCTHWPNDDRLGRRPALHLDASEWLFRHYSALGGQLAGVINSLGQKRRGAQTAIRAAQIRSHWPVKNGTAPLGPEAACISLTLNILIDCLFPRSFSSAVGCFVSTNETSVIGRAFFSLFFWCPSGRLVMGCGGSYVSRQPDILVQGTGVEPLHCCIENIDGIVTLYPMGEMTSVDGIRAITPVRLTQGTSLPIKHTSHRLAKFYGNKIVNHYA